MVEVDGDDVSDNSEDECLLNQEKMMHKGENDVCGEKVDVDECSEYSEVPAVPDYPLGRVGNCLWAPRLLGTP